MYYPNKMRSYLVTIVPMARFTPKSTSKLRPALHFRYSIVIPCVLPYNPKRNPNNHYNHSFHNTFNYNYLIFSNYLLYTVTASAHIMHWSVIVTLQ